MAHVHKGSGPGLQMMSAGTDFRASRWRSPDRGQHAHAQGVLCAVASSATLRYAVAQCRQYHLDTAGCMNAQAMMAAEADAFIALPGGFGTLEEVTPQAHAFQNCRCSTAESRKLMAAVMSCVPDAALTVLWPGT